MNEKLPLETSVKEIISRIVTLRDRCLSEIKVDWVKCGYGFFWKPEQMTLLI